MDITKEELKEVKKKLYEAGPDLAVTLAPLYQFLDWEWARSLDDESGEIALGVPDESDILVTIIELISELDVGKVDRVETGGLMAEYFRGGDGEIIGQIGFSLSKEIEVDSDAGKD